MPASPGAAASHRAHRFMRIGAGSLFTGCYILIDKPFKLRTFEPINLDRKLYSYVRLLFVLSIRHYRFARTGVQPVIVAQWHILLQCTASIEEMCGYVLSLVGGVLLEVKLVLSGDCRD